MIPCHNAASDISRALQSIRNQSLVPAEVIVIDDASTDASSAVAQRHGARVERHRAQRGAAAARNTGLRAAATPLVAFLDADDAWEPHHLEMMRRGVSEAPDAVLWLSGSSRETSAGTFAGFAPAARHAQDVEPVHLLLQHVVATTSGAVVLRDAALAEGGFDESVDYVPSSCEDFDLWLRLAARGRVRALDTVTVRYLVSDAQRTAARLEGNERARLCSVSRALDGLHATAQTERQVWAATYYDLGKWHLKHGSRRTARRRLRSSLRYVPRQPQTCAWLAVSMLPPALVGLGRRAVRRARGRRGDPAVPPAASTLA